MSPVFHIGPPKTATTSLQETVIPRLGNRYQIKPLWTRRLASDKDFAAPPDLAPDTIVSDEALGGFACFSPDIVAQRLSRYEGATVIFCIRDPVELFYSLYRQRLINGISLLPEVFAKQQRLLVPDSPGQFLEGQRQQYEQSGMGFLSVVHTSRVRSVFSRYFAFETLDFEILNDDAGCFVSRFAQACGSNASPEISHANRADHRLFEQSLNALPDAVPASIRAMYLIYYDTCLSSRGEDLIRSVATSSTAYATARPVTSPADC